MELTAEEARNLTDRIKTHVEELLPLIKVAYERRADLALGYKSWNEYCDSEFHGIRLPIEKRREAVAELRQTGMSTRAIGAALGVSDTTVVRDLSTASFEAVAESNRVISLDGRERPAEVRMRENHPELVNASERAKIEQQITSLYQRTKERTIEVHMLYSKLEIADDQLDDKLKKYIVMTIDCLTMLQASIGGFSLEDIK